jgi:ABC-type iron transport system FetAB permease component
MLKNQRDLLSILLGVAVIPGIWIAQGMGLLALPGEVIGATIAGETLVIQFYFRKSEPPNGS